MIGVSGGLDSTHALIVAARAMDLLGLPRTNILGYTMPGFATGDVDQVQRLGADARARASARTSWTSGRRPGRCSTDLDHPFGRGEEVYDVTFENVQAGLRTDYLFRLANHHRGDRARHRRPVRAGARLEHVRRRRPDVALQRQRRGAQDADPAPDPLGRAGWTTSPSEVDEILLSILNTEISPELIPVKEGEVPQSTEKSIGPYELQDFNLFYTLRFGFRPSKIAFLAHHAWRDVDGGQLAAGLPAGAPPRLRPAGDPRVAGGVRQAVLRVRQFKRSAMPNGPKVSAGGSLSPRGDWRAPSDGNAAVWLADIEQNIPAAEEGQR